MLAQKKSALDPEKIRWKNHITHDKMIRVRLPIDWEIDENFMSFNLFVKSAYEDEDDKFAENLSIYFQEMKGLTPEVMLASYLSEAEKQLHTLLKDVKMSPVRNFKLHGASAFEFIASGTQDGTGLKWKQVCVVKGERIFTLTFTAEMSQFSRYIQIADIIMQSIEIR